VTWKAIVHSAMGTRHEQRGQPCQDYGNYRIEGAYLLGAVADGAGSAKRAEVGAKIAVESALEAISQELTRSFAIPLHGPTVPSYEEIEAIAPALFTTVFEEVLTALHREAHEQDHDLRDLGCTLLVLLATPDWVAAMQIGDGFIVLRSGEAESYQLLFEPDKGEFINETVFVTTEGAIDYMDVGVQPCKSPFLCAATDGLERVAIRLQDWEPFTPFFKPFEACLTQLPDQQDRQDYLKTFLESERLNSKTDDDKTMLACLYDRDKQEGL
jgi:hypothetical protein